MDPSLRWDDGDMVRRDRSARTVMAWVPAFAGMTVTWFAVIGVPVRVMACVPAFAGMTVTWFAAIGVPVR